MDLLLIDSSNYGDPLDRVWHADLRLTTAYLKRCGFDVGVKFIPTPDHPQRVIELAHGLIPKRILLEINADNRGVVLSFVSRYKAHYPQTCMLLGGPLASLAPGELLNAQADVDGVVVGERERPLEKLLGQRKRADDITGVPGIFSRDGTFEPSPPLEELAALGRMDFDGLDGVGGTAFIQQSRGCYARCSFCVWPSLQRSHGGPRWRPRPIEHVVDEIQTLVDVYGVRRFAFQDANFFGPGSGGQRRARSFAATLIDRGLEIEYFLSCRVNDVVFESFELLRESGLSIVGIGVESLNQESLNRFSKGLKVKQIFSALELLEELGIDCEVNLIFFEPQMTMEAVRQNLALFDYLRDKCSIRYSDAFPFNCLYPDPGSQLGRTLRQKGLVDEEAGTCRFEDPAVGALVQLVDKLRSKVPPMFKRKLGTNTHLAASKRDQADIPSSLQVSRNELATDELVDELSRTWSHVRRWVGQIIMPRYLHRACDVLDGQQHPDVSCLDALVDDFDKKMDAVRDLEFNLQRMMCSAGVKP